MIASLSFRMHKPAVQNIRNNFTLVYPGATNEELTEKTRRLFRNYAEYLVDYGRFSALDRSTLLEKIVRFEGEENLNRALDMKKGLILLTAHLGNWELGGIYFSAYGLKVNVVTLPDEDREINSSRSRYRERYGVKTITVGDSPLSSVSLVNALMNNEVVAMLIDRYGDRKDSIAVRFFDGTARFPLGPFMLSRIMGAPIVVAFVIREKDGYKGFVEEPLIVEHKAMERETLGKVVRMFERYIVKYPEQWYDFR
jgi:lauroyl/myristoyl acyltransferase